MAESLITGGPITVSELAQNNIKILTSTGGLFKDSTEGGTITMITPSKITYNGSISMVFITNLFYIYQNNGTCIPSLDVKIYPVMWINNGGKFTISDNLANYGVANIQIGVSPGLGRISPYIEISMAQDHFTATVKSIYILRDNSTPGSAAQYMFSFSMAVLP